MTSANGAYRPKLPGWWALLLLASGQVAAVEALRFDIERVDGEYWSAEGVTLDVMLGTTDPIAAELKIRRVVLPAPVGAIGPVDIRCKRLSLMPDEYRCSRARLTVAESLLDDRAFTADIRYRPLTGVVSFSSGDVPLFGLQATVSGRRDAAAWSARLRADGLDAAGLYAGLSGATPLPGGAEIYAGSAGIEMSIAVTGDAAPVTEVSISIADLAMSNESGTLATDGLAARFDATMEADRDTAGGPLGFRLETTLDGGEAYIEPVYFDFAAPLRIEAGGALDPDAQRAKINGASYVHRDALSATGDAVLSWDGRPAIDSASITIVEAAFPAMYRMYVQGFLVGTPLAKLDTRGSMRGAVELQDNRYTSIDLVIDDFDADDRDKRLALYGAEGELHWRSDARSAAPPTRIGWDGGFVYAIGYGGSSMTLALAGDDIELVDPLRVPILNGALVIDTFVARDLAAERPALDLDAQLEPVGLRRLTTAFGWPAFPGSLSGELPRLTLRDGVVTLGGSLVARAFDGMALISDLRVEQPFSPNRTASADIELDNLDLGLMTEVFSLGRITGRLSGRIDDLQTVKDRPVAFDARLATPENGAGRRRISRRAINNLSEIAGGSAALLTTGFLKIFEEFGYSSIAITCRLRRDVCEMGGLKPAGNGYYIVEGRGLPRINVIGHVRKVNWPRMVAQIQEALKAPSPTVGQPSESEP